MSRRSAQRREVGRRARGPVSRCWMFSAPTDQPPDASGEPRAGEKRNRIARRRQADPPAEEEDHVLRRVLPAAAAAAAATAAAVLPGAELEDAGVLEEEVALLGKEQAEAREVDLLLVGFDLREVGVDGEVPRQTLTSRRTSRRTPASKSPSSRRGRELVRGCRARTA